jgi:hypothetical protein
MKIRWTIKTTVPESHKLQIDVPPQIPPGPTTLAVAVISEEGLPSYVTAEDLLASGIYGMWEDRQDTKESASFVDQLRRAEEERRGLHR